jgi:hypothetical protein
MQAIFIAVGALQPREAAIMDARSWVWRIVCKIVASSVRIESRTDDRTDSIKSKL